MSEPTTRAVAWRDYMMGFAYIQMSNYKDRNGNPMELTQEIADCIAKNAAKMATALTGYDPKTDGSEAPQQ